MDLQIKSKRQARRNIKRWGIVLKNNRQERITEQTNTLAAITFKGYEYQKPNTSVVYWIRQPEHQDIFMDGYIGVTHQPVIDRWRSHISNRKRGAIRGRPISVALIKQPELLFSVISVHGTLQAAMDIEAKLRPHPFIGWNTAAGANIIDPVTGGKAVQRAILNKRKEADPTYYQGKNRVLLAQRKWENDQRMDRIKYYKEVFAPLLIPYLSNVRKAHKRNKSGVLGVTWYTKHQRWRAQVKLDTKVIGLGYFKTIEEAAQIRQSAQIICDEYRKQTIDLVEALHNIRKLNPKEPYHRRYK